MEKDLSFIANHIPISDTLIIENKADLQDVDQFSPLVLAYIGDAIYELIIRTYIVKKANKAVNKLHKESANLVKAKTQAEFAKILQEEFTEKELAIYKRGRNAKSHSIAKNASLSEYKHATAFEAVLGYLYLNNDLDRILFLIKKAFEKNILN